MSARAVFLDRDGTISKDVHFCSRVEDFEILPNAPQAIRLLNRHGFKVIVVTNQSGVGRGYFTEDALHDMHRYMRRELARHGAFIDAIYYCDHHPADGCDCRKPKPELLLRAARDCSVDLNRSFMVGDAERDMAAGKAAGCRTALITGNGKGREVSPDYVAADLLQAVHWILGDNGSGLSRGRVL